MRAEDRNGRQFRLMAFLIVRTMTHLGIERMEEHRYNRRTWGNKRGIRCEKKIAAYISERHRILHCRFLRFSYPRDTYVQIRMKRYVPGIPRIQVDKRHRPLSLW